MKFAIIVLLLATALSAVSPLDEVKGRPWFQAFRSNDQSTALALFRKQYSQNKPLVFPDVYFYCELLMRQDNKGDLEQICKRLLKRDSRDPWALRLYGQWYYRNWMEVSGKRAELDSAEYYLKRSLEENPVSDAGETLWIVETLLGDSAGVEAAKLTLKPTLSPAVEAYARWLLETMPQNAILITFGDGDTFPLLYLQAKEHVRPDVVVANSSLLNLKLYTRNFARINGIPLWFTNDEFTALEHKLSGGSQEVTTIAMSIIDRWASHAGIKKGRPVVAAISVDSSSLPERMVQNNRFFGSYYAPVYHQTPAGELRELAIIDSVIERIDTTSLDSFASEYVHPSPVLMAANLPHSMIQQYLSILFRGIEKHADRFETSKAMELVALSRTIADKGNLAETDTLRSRIDEYETYVRNTEEQFR